MSTDTSATTFAHSQTIEDRSEPIATTSKILVEDLPGSPSDSLQLDKCILRRARRLQRKISQCLAAEGNVKQLSLNLAGPIEQLNGLLRRMKESRPSKQNENRLLSLYGSLQRLILHLSGSNVSQTRLLEDADLLQTRLISLLSASTAQERLPDIISSALCDTLAELAKHSSSRLEWHLLRQLRLLGFCKLPHSVALQSLLCITGIALRSDVFAQYLGQAIAADQDSLLPLPRTPSNLEELHKTLFLDVPAALSASASRTYGPSLALRDLHGGVAYLISCLALCPQPEVGQWKEGMLDTVQIDRQMQLRCVVSLSRRIRRTALPLDRQIISAVLLLAKRVGRKEAEALQSSMSYLWQEWTLLRENDPQPSADDLLHRGFLNSISAYSTDLWQQQAIELVLSTLEVHRTRPGANMQNGFRGPNATDSVEGGLLKSTALAAIRTGRLAIALECLCDGRAGLEATLMVVWSLTAHMDLLTSSMRPLAGPLAHTIAGVVENLVPLIATRLGQTNAPTGKMRDAISYIATHLFDFQHPKVARSLLRLIQEPAAVSISLLKRLFRRFVVHEHQQLALSWYRRLKTEQQQDSELLQTMLPARLGALSDAAWQALTRRGNSLVTEEQLEARLQHHIAARGARHAKALSEVHKYREEGDAELPTAILVRLLELHTAAGKPAWTRRMLKRVTARPDAPYDLINRVLPIARQPRKRTWRHSGPAATMSRVVAELDYLIQEEGLAPDRKTADWLLLESLKWGALDDAGIWKAFCAGLQDKEERDWLREVKPLYQMVIRAYRTRGNMRAARDVVWMMRGERDRRRGTLAVRVSENDIQR